MPDKASRPPRLALVIHALSGGGAERVLSNMANHWSRSGNQVTLITLAAVETDVYATDESVERVGLDVMRESRGTISAIWNNARRIAALRRALRIARPDFVISFTDQINTLTLLATIGLRLRVIVCDRTDPRHHPLGRVWSGLRRRLYPRCHAAVVQTRAVAEFIQPLVKRRPVYVIPNAVSPEVRGMVIETAPDEHTATRPRRLVAMGRLSSEKGFDLLIDAFAQLQDRRPQWSLHIFGEGPLHDALQQQIVQSQLENDVHLAGWTNHPLNELARADLFVLPSRYEGFPNVLLDAMSLGVPVVSFQCPAGPEEIIRSEVDGLLVEPENTTALAAALERLMADDSLRERLGRRAPDVNERFSEERFYQRWEILFQDAERTESVSAPVERT